ncbi:Amino acid kinase family protein [Rosistilla ulvae]|uniref:Amino acid kinase family protein n=1 Tax=Rosistilla ulvae TaxID=1930277 RepID=A0A517M4F3_9BACT|nr:hypothetical protein [Rosistilla ulvae]QDS89746.1 Amino acid kinase family protein [Rosistilla ulvae]
MTDKKPPIRVVKLGGSLLINADLEVAVRRWLTAQTQRKTAIIVGGGELIDVMRAMDRRFELDLAAMHWRCIRLLRHTFEIVAELMPELVPIGDATTLNRWSHDSRDRSAALVAVDAFYGPNSRGPISLPTNWATTTDSIAALLAQQLEATDLVLLKSCSVAKEIDWPEAARREIVDAAFPQFIEGIPEVRMVNLKDHLPGTTLQRED